MPAFTIAIPAYNRSSYLRCALRSAVSQKLKDVEILVSDDASEENLQLVVNEFQGSAIKYSRSECRIGASRNHQRAASLANGEFIVFLHSDDALLPSFCEKTLECMRKWPNAGAVIVATIQANGMRLECPSAMPAVEFADFSVLRGAQNLEGFTGTYPSACALRRSSFERIGGYRKDLSFVYDWELYRRMLVSGGGVCFEPTIQTVYRRHSEQAIQRETLNGLSDVIRLFQEKAHGFNSGDVAEQVLYHFAQGLRGRRRLRDLDRVIRESRAYGTVVNGLPKTLWRKVLRRLMPARELHQSMRSSNCTLEALIEMQKLWEAWNNDTAGGEEKSRACSQ